MNKENNAVGMHLPHCVFKNVKVNKTYRLISIAPWRNSLILLML